jgi:hypothetical protein
VYNNRSDINYKIHYSKRGVRQAKPNSTLYYNNRKDELNSYITNMNFEKVWEFVNSHAERGSCMKLCQCTPSLLDISQVLLNQALSTISKNGNKLN